MLSENLQGPRKTIQEVREEAANANEAGKISSMILLAIRQFSDPEEADKLLQTYLEIYEEE